MKFQPGKSGNPSGKKPGSGHRQKLFSALVAPRKEELLNAAINMALDGNEAMLRLLLERLLPAKPTDEPVNIDLPIDMNQSESLLQIGNNILLSLSQSEITPNEALTLLQVIASHRENIVVHDLWKQLQEFKKQSNKKLDQPIGEDE